MKIVVLDGYTLNPGDLTWDALRELGNCEIHDRTPDDQIIARAGGAEALLTNKTALSRETIGQLPDLKYIGVLATGFNIIDIDAAAERNIPVANVPTYGSESVAQAVFAHLLSLAQHVEHHVQTVRDGRWATSKDFCYWDYPLIELSGLTMGIVGLGRIGRATAKLASAFGMKVIASDVYRPDDVPEGVELVQLDEVFHTSDVISLHCPLTPDTENLVNTERLAMMKPSAFLINTSRGPLIDENALADALRFGRLAGAGLDVLSVEPPVPHNPLLTVRNCHITPHISWATRSARSRLLDTVIENLAAFQNGSPQNVVN